MLGPEWARPTVGSRKSWPPSEWQHMKRCAKRAAKRGRSSLLDATGNGNEGWSVASAKSETTVEPPTSSGRGKLQA